MTDEGRDALIESEGKRSAAYVDEAGLLTIGIGHLITAEELKTGIIHIGNDDVEYSKGLTDEQIDTLFDQDMLPREVAVRSLVKVPLTPHQSDALVSFAYNVGIGAFQTSTLLKKLNANDYASVPDQMRRWNKVHNPATGELVVSQGLSDRREREIELWNEV